MTLSPTAQMLLDARSSGTPLETLPEALVPATREAAYAIHDEIVAALGAVGGWKVSPVPADGGDPTGAPILARDIVSSGATLAKSDLPGIAVEVEVAVTLGHDLPGGASPEAVAAAIGSLHVALELVSSRFVDRKAVPALAAFADLQSNGAVILGDGVPYAGFGELADLPMTLTLDRGAAEPSSGGVPTANVLAALAWLATHAAAHGKPLQAGQVVITGARMGPTNFSGTQIMATGQGLGEVTATLA